MATFSTDVGTEPTYIDFIDIGAGYGVLAVPIDGLFAGDVVQLGALAIAPTAGGAAIITASVDMVQRTSGYFAFDSSSSITAFFSLSAAQIALIAAGNFSYSVTLSILRNGVALTREVQGGTIAARTSMSPPSPIIVGSIMLTGGPVTGAIGTTHALAATAYDALGNAIPTAVITWSSSNALIASVDQSGLVSFLLPGSTTIIASSMGVQDTTAAVANDPAFVAPTNKQVAGWLTSDGVWKPRSLDASWIKPGTFDGTGGGNFAFPNPVTAPSFVGDGSGLTAIGFAHISGLPTTLAGYGVTDAYTKTASDGRYAPVAGPFPWADVTGAPTFLTSAGPFPWANVASTPTTLAGYGVTDAYTKTASDARYAPIAGPFPWADVTGAPAFLTASGPFPWANLSSVPTTVSGYGITDAYTKTQADARYAAIAGPFPWGDVSGTPTTLSGFGIADAYTKTAADARYAPIAGPFAWANVSGAPAFLTSSGPFPWANVSGSPTTAAGYGIADVYTKTAADARYAPIAGPFPWADVSGAPAFLTSSGPFPWANVSGSPTTVAGYGITDAYTKTAADARYAPIAGPFPWADVTGAPTFLTSTGPFPWANVSGHPTTIGGYGITDLNSLGDARWSPLVGSTSTTTLGTIVTGVWNGSSISTTYTDAKIVAVAGTTNRLTASTSTGSVTLDISSAYVGQNTITTLGTVTTGTWAATAIAAVSGGTGQTVYVVGDILYANSTNTLARLAGNTIGGQRFLSQTGTGSASAAPVWDVIQVADVNDLATAATGITQVGVLTTGTWHANVIDAQYGGTGTNNAGKTIAIGGNFTLSGAFTTTLNVSGNTTLTLPTNGTLVTSAVTSLAQLVTTGVLASPHFTAATVDSGGLAITNGNLAVGGGVSAGIGINVATNGLTGTTQQAINIGLLFGSGATTNAYGLHIGLGTAAASYTLPSLYNIYVGDVSEGSGSSVTNQYGLYVASMSSATNNYAIWTNDGVVRFGDAVTISSGGLNVTDAVNGSDLVLSGSPTNVRQIQFGTSTAIGSVGTSFSSASAYLAYNAYQPTSATNLWHQNLTTAPSTWLTLNSGGLSLWAAPIGQADAASATFWSSPVFTVSLTGVVTCGDTTFSGGNIGIGTASSVTSSILLGGTLNTGGFQYGVQGNWTGSSSATSGMLGFYSNPKTQAAAFTVANLYHFYANDVVIGAASAVTTQYGVYVGAMTAATNNYAIYTNAGKVRLGDDLTVVGTITGDGPSRLTGNGNSGTTAASWRFGDNNSGSSRDWAITDGYGAGTLDIGALNFTVSSAANGDPIANTATVIFRLTSGGATVTGSMKTTGAVGFNNVAPLAKPTITGSRGGNAALAGLLTQLALYGLIIDSTT